MPTQANSDTSWFDNLPDAPSGPQPPGQISVNVGDQPRPVAPQTIARPTNGGVAGTRDTSWFDSLPDASTPETKAPSAGVSVKPSSGPDLPAWAGGGQQPALPQAAAPSEKPSWSNIAEAIPAGAYEGVTRIPNMPTDILNTASDVMHGLTGQNYGHLQPPMNTNPTGFVPWDQWARSLRDATSAASNAVALGGVGRMVTPLLPAGSAAQAVSRAIETPSVGTLAAIGAGGAAEEPIAKNVPEAYQPYALLGANLAAAGGVAGAEGLIGNATRSTIGPETARLAQAARDTYDIPITAAQISGNPNIKRLDSVLKNIPFSGHGDLDEEVQHAVNQAVALHGLGEPNVTKITPGVVQRVLTRTGGVMNDVEARNPVTFDGPFRTDIQNILTNSQASMTQPEVNTVTRLMDGVIRNAQPGATGPQIAGQTYGNLIHKGSPLDAATNSANTNIRNAALQIKDALRGSLQRSLSGDDAAAYTQARTQYKNLVSIVEPSLKGADVVGGSSASTGDINPVTLRGFVNRSYPDNARRALGEIPLADIADIGQRFLKQSGSSGTAERSYMMNMLSHLAEGGGLVAGGAGLMHHGIPSPSELGLLGGGLAATGLAARGVSGVMRSDALANRMIRQGLSGPQAGKLQSAANVSVPLMTEAGMRQLEPPSEGSNNPQTGLPQFNLQDKQADNKRDLASHIVGQIKDGTLASPNAMKNYLAANKQALRPLFGGQGMQNIMFVQAMMRRPSNVYSLMQTTPASGPMQSAMNDAGISDPHGLAALAITSPALAKILASPTSRVNLTKSGEAQLINGIRAAIGAPNDQGVPNANSGVSPASLHAGLPGGNRVGENRPGNRPGMQPTMAPLAAAGA